MSLNGMFLIYKTVREECALEAMVLHISKGQVPTVGPSGYHYHVNGDFTTKRRCKLGWVL